MKILLLTNLTKLLLYFSDDIEYISVNEGGTVTGINGRKNYDIVSTGVRGGYEKVQKVDIIAGRMINDKRL